MEEQRGKMINDSCVVMVAMVVMWYYEIDKVNRTQGYY